MTIKQRMLLMEVGYGLQSIQVMPHGYVRSYMVSDVRKLVAELRHSLKGNK